MFLFIFSFSKERRINNTRRPSHCGLPHQPIRLVRCCLSICVFTPVLFCRYFYYYYYYHCCCYTSSSSSILSSFVIGVNVFDVAVFIIVLYTLVYYTWLTQRKNNNNYNQNNNIIKTITKSYTFTCWTKHCI